MDPSANGNGHLPQPSHCPVCSHPDRDLVENLLLSAMSFAQVSADFDLPVHALRYHELNHSTKQPSIDALHVLLAFKYLAEKADELVHDAAANTDTRNTRILAERSRSIQVASQVYSKFADLINAPSQLDSRVTLPRWTAVIRKLGEKLRDVPGATEVLLTWAREEGPKTDTTLTPELVSRIPHLKLNDPTEDD